MTTITNKINFVINMPHKVDTIYIIFTCVKDKKLSKQYQYYSVFKTDWSANLTHTNIDAKSENASFGDP